MRITEIIGQGIAAVAIASCACATARAQVTVSNQPSQALFHGQQAEDRSPEIGFDSATGMVTLKVSVQDINGFFIPNLRRSNFAVLEDGVRQPNATIDVEHTPTTLALLVEMGGRSHELNTMLATEAAYMARPVLDVLGPEDKLAVFTYDDRLHTVMDFDAPHEKWEKAFSGIQPPQFSEANLYDAASALLDRLAIMPGRKALLLVSTGIDTFSHATFDDMVKKAEQTKTPVYVVGLGELARQSIGDTTRGPLARVDWRRSERQLETLARTSGGRAYSRAKYGRPGNDSRRRDGEFARSICHYLRLLACRGDAGDAAARPSQAGRPVVG